MLLGPGFSTPAGPCTRWMVHIVPLSRARRRLASNMASEQIVPTGEGHTWTLPPAVPL